MAATIASRCARGTSSRRKAAKPNLPRARNCARRRLAELARLDDAAFRALFAKSPVKRIGRDRFIRNVLIAIGNADDASLAPEAERLLDDASPLVRGAAVWALSQLMARERLRRWRSAMAETDESVRAEWRARSNRHPAKARHPKDEHVVPHVRTHLIVRLADETLTCFRHVRPAMTNQPFFAKRGDTFIPNPVSNGPWDPNSMHGRVVIGLLAHVIEERHGSDEFVPARLTVDMFRLPNIQTPVEVTTKLVRDGKRIKVVEAEFFSGGTSMARASCQLLRRTENAPGNVWSPSNWDAPSPDTIPTPTDPRLGMNGKWTTRPIVGHMGSLGPRRLWMSEVRELVEGVPMSPFVHVATGADFASPFANAGDQGLGYINSDVTLYLHRLPVTRWIGFDVVNHHASDGIAIGECWLYDEKGPIGTSTVAALAQRKPMTNVPPP